jgi:hypothetical protein
MGSDSCRIIDKRTVMPVRSTPDHIVWDTSADDDMRGDAELGLSMRGVTGVSQGVGGAEDIEEPDEERPLMVVGSGGGSRRMDVDRARYPRMRPGGVEVHRNLRTSAIMYASSMPQQNRLLLTTCQVL